MINATHEMFLSEFFIIRAILGNTLTEGEKLFFGLGKMFFLSEESLRRLFGAVEAREVAEIQSEQDYARYLRMSRYARMVGADDGTDSAVEEMIRIKGNALTDAKNLKLVPEADASRNAVYNYLSAAADEGMVCALRVIGILQCEGVFLERNTAAGLKSLGKAADWNDVVSLLALLAYGKDKAFNISRLHMVVRDTPFARLYDAAKAKYREPAVCEVKEVELLNKVFNSGVLKRETYVPRYARVLYGKALCFKDKENAMFNDREYLATIVGLPLKLSSDAQPLHHEPVATLFGRESEQNAVTNALENGDLRRLSAYRPPCITGDCRFLLNQYAEAIAAGFGGHTEVIDVGSLTEYDLEPTANNVFIRSADEDADNCYLLFFIGDVPQRAMNSAVAFLQSDVRAKFHLNSPCATLDLGDVLPVCFCDKQNAKRLRLYCDVLTLAEIKAEEKPLVICDIVGRKSRLYGVADVRITDDALGMLQGYDADSAEKILDEAIRAFRRENAAVTLTAQSLAPYMPNSRGDRIIGFGGVIGDVE